MARKQAAARIAAEVSVAGGLGPVLENALFPWVSSGPQLVTVVRTSVPHGVDVLDLFARLAARSVEVVEIWLVESDRGEDPEVSAGPWGLERAHRHRDIRL